MNGGECGYACGFCQRPFRTISKKLRHLKECKEMVPDTRVKHIHPVFRDGGSAGELHIVGG